MDVCLYFISVEQPSTSGQVKDMPERFQRIFEQWNMDKNEDKVCKACRLVPKWWYKKLWKWQMFFKIKCFIWFAFENCLFTWDNLLHRGGMDANLCILCIYETSFCLLFFVVFHYRALDLYVCEILKIKKIQGLQSLQNNFHLWYKDCHKLAFRNHGKALTNFKYNINYI